VQLSAGATEVVTGLLHACAIHTTGDVQCSGDNTFDELGDGTSGGSSNTPHLVQGL
jgi:alpha-tubulin suppressor-like RCC1 family protein